MNDIPSRLKQLRTGRELTQKAVAISLGITQQAYSNYERGKRDIPVLFVYRLSALYEVSADYILGIQTCFEGSIDLSAPYIHNVPLADIVRDLQSLHRQNRVIAAHYIHMLRQSEQHLPPQPPIQKK